jgi:mono/diheme cytochrome c family protein
MRHHIRKLAICLVAYAAGSVSAAAQESNSQPAAASDAAAGTGKSVTTALYQVQDGNKVDPKTLMGWKTWRAMACERCHGASQEGLVGPSLVNSLKVLSKDQFHTTIINGRPEKGMPNFSAAAMVQENWEGLYAYLKGRSEGNIQPGHLYPINAPAAASAGQGQQK